MMGRTHVIIGVSYGVNLIPAVTRNDLTPAQLGFVMCGLVIGSLLPDIDHPHSLISQQIPLVGGIISRLTSHRGLFHSILGVAILIVGLGMLSALIAGGLSSIGIQGASDATAQISTGTLIGYILHIIADMITVNGVKLFYPLKANVGLPLIRTGGNREWILAMALIIISFLQVFTVLPSIPALLV